MKSARFLMLFGAVAVLGMAPVSAQPITSAVSGAIAYLEGKVYLNNDLLESSLTRFPNIKEGGVLRTEDGRAEVLLTPGMILRLGENSSMQMITNRLIDTRLELLTGSAVIEADTTEKDTAVTLVCKKGVATIDKVGIYRFDSEPARLKVFKGEASVKLGSETVESSLVSTGKMIGLGEETASIEKFDVEETDALDRWSSRRGMVLAMANPSSAKSASNGPGFGGGGWGGGIGMGGIGIGMGGWGMGGPGYGMGMGMGMGYCGWVYNPWYGVYTYVPCYGMGYSPYGYPYWSPYTVGGGFYNPVRNGGLPPSYGRSSGGGGGATPSTLSRGASASTLGRSNGGTTTSSGGTGLGTASSGTGLSGVGVGRSSAGTGGFSGSSAGASSGSRGGGASGGSSGGGKTGK